MLVRASEVYTLFPPLLRYARDVKRQSGFDFMFGGNKREKEKKDVQLDCLGVACGVRRTSKLCVCVY